LSSWKIFSQFAVSRRIGRRFRLVPVVPKKEPSDIFRLDPAVIRKVNETVNDANLVYNMRPVFAGHLIYLPVKNGCIGSNATGI
jgi:hypothetical protein